MNLALRGQTGVQTASGHGVINANLKSGHQRIAPAKAVFDARVPAVKGVDHVADEFALNRDRCLATRQITHRRGNEHNRHRDQALVEIAFQSTGGEIGRLVMRHPVAA